jgi:hypothetical protein
MQKSIAVRPIILSSPYDRSAKIFNTLHWQYLIEMNKRFPRFVVFSSRHAGNYDRKYPFKISPRSRSFNRVKKKNI